MSWRFSILDRNNVATVIEEPVGFDANIREIKRDADYHGIFFNNQGEPLEFYDAAKLLLKAEYDEYGWEGNMTLVMEEDCGNGYEEDSRGKFVFSSYENYGSYVKVPVETTSEVMDLRNRINQKVNLETLKSFDETTDLASYDKLPFELQLPSKGIFMQDKAEWEKGDETLVNLQELPLIEYNAGGGENYNSAWFEIVPQFDKIDFSEFGNFMTAPVPEHHFIQSGFYNDFEPTEFEKVTDGKFSTLPDTRRILFDWATATALLVNDKNDNNFDAVKNFSLDISYSFELQLKDVAVSALYHIIVIKRKNGTYEYLDKRRIFSGISGGGFGGYNSGSIWLKNSTNTVSFDGVYQNISLSDGDYLFVAVCGLAVYSNYDARDSKDAYNIVSKSGSVKMETLSHFATTISKVFAINETISRIAESTTNNKLKAYSEYFGRTDSQPYSVTEDGCGSLEVITDGIRIRRQENKTPGQTNVFSQSLQDIFEGLAPIHNIGMGIEADTNRPGYNRLRIEPWNFFYNDTVIMSCTGVNNLVRKTNAREVYSTFQFGYNKWEAEEYNGLDELLTKRNYRTTLSQVKNDLIKLSKYIASGYALEITRRKGNENTKDWRYDKEVFIVCVKRGSTADFLIQFVAPNTLKVAVFGDDYNFTQDFFKVGSTITISSPLNSGTYTITAASIITGNISVTIGESVVNELSTATVTNDTGLVVELGNVTNPVNIIDPDTLYNYRITPLRNAMRWMNRVFGSYKKFNAEAKIIFTDGDGNYFAEGELTGAGCKLEAGSLVENQTVDPASFADSNNAKPSLMPERVTYDYPMNSHECKLLEANPYGLIYFEDDCDQGYGYIDTITYKQALGMATFNLIPKFN